MPETKNLSEPARIRMHRHGKRQATINEMALRRLRGENAQLLGSGDDIRAMNAEIDRLVATVNAVLEGQR